MNVRYDQTIFRENWNLIANFVNSKTNEKLPTLSVDGNCEGISLTLFEYISRDKEAEFYDLYHWVCTEKPEAFANLITTYFTQKLFNSKMEKLFTFIAQIKILQDKYLISATLDLNNKSGNDENNFKRIGTLNKQESLFYPRHAGQIENAIKNLSIGSAKMIIVGNKSGSHALCIYRIIPKEVFLYDKYVFPSRQEAEQYKAAHANNSNNNNENDIITIKDYNGAFWYGFNPNDGQRRAFSNPNDLSKYIMRSANIDLHPLADHYRAIAKLSSPLQTIFTPVKSFLNKKLSDSIQNISDSIANDHFWMTVTEDENITKAENEAEVEAKLKVTLTETIEEKIASLLLNLNQHQDNFLEKIEVSIIQALKDKPLDEKFSILESVFERIKNNTKNHQAYQTQDSLYNLPSFLYNNSINQKQRDHLRIIKKIYFTMVSEVLVDKTISAEDLKKIVEKVQKQDNLIHYPLEFKGTTNTSDLLHSLISQFDLEDRSEIDKSTDKTSLQKKS